jgi:magnesium transporter
MQDLTHTIISDLDKQKYSEVVSLLQKLHHADIADLIERLQNDYRVKLIEVLGENFAPEILIELNRNVRKELIDKLDRQLIATTINKLPSDEIIYIFAYLEEEQHNLLIPLIEPSAKQNAVQEGLSYPENSAGRMMNKTIISIPSLWKIGDVISYLKHSHDLSDELYQIFVTDETRRLIGSIALKDLFINDKNDVVQDIMNRDLTIIDAFLDQEDVSYLFKKYSLISAPVVNKDNRLVGTVVISDVLSVMEEEIEEDMMLMAGVNDSDLYSSVIDTMKRRFPWLFINLLTACITSTLIDIFQSTIHQIVTLAAIMPIVASMGGNAGTQTLTVAVRAIAHKEFDMGNAYKIISKEMFSHLINGIILATIGGVILLLWHNHLSYSLVFAVAVVINFVLAGFLGASIPLALSKLGVDPAIASGVFLTAMTDIIGFTSFLMLATFLLTN